MLGLRGIATGAIAAIPETAAAAVTPEFGWYEQAGKPAFGTRRLPDNSYVRAPINFTVATPSALGWFEPYPKRPPVGIAPASSVSWDPRAVAATPTLTTDIGWFEPYAKRPPQAKGPASSTSWDPQIVAAPPTLTTSIGWYTQYGLPPAKAKSQLSAWSSFFGFRPDLGIGWFEPYSSLPRLTKAPGSSQAFVAPVTAAAAAQPSFGWYFSFSLPPRKLQSIAAGWITTLPEPVIPPVPPADCGHLYPTVSAGADLIPGVSKAGGLVETISTAGRSTVSISSSGSSKATVSKGGSLKSDIPC